VSVTFPRGFRASAVAAGLKPSGAPDLALLLAERPCPSTGLFTTNAFAAAPVTLSRERLAGRRALGVLVNSGQANAGTGPSGLDDAHAATASVTNRLGVPADTLLACSTGVIGEPVHLAELLAGIPALVEGLSNAGGDAFATAILTTDSRPKQATATSGRFRVGGCAKGAGMIAPELRLATMLAFITTDAPLAPADVDRLATEVLAPAFEGLTVDGCTSTNDTVLLLASGEAGRELVVPGSTSWAAVAEALGSVAGSLVEQLAEDAEGAEHVLLVEVEGAVSDADARAVARAIADSPLVKTAVFGGDPNPGRLLQAIGAAPASLDPSRVDVRIGEAPVIAGGAVCRSSADGWPRAARAALSCRRVDIGVSLGDGPGRSRCLGVDLSPRYIEINSEYTT
jgi:glutamate N-acetyltransferase/amino-acid N-acetyltransferase